MKKGWISTQEEMTHYCGMCTKTFIKISKKKPIPKVKVGAVLNRLVAYRQRRAPLPIRGMVWLENNIIQSPYI
jgi:hypothetical protein